MQRIKDENMRVGQFADKIKTLAARCEDIASRAQKTFSASRSAPGFKDKQFFYDLQAFKNIVRATAKDAEPIVPGVARLERADYGGDVRAGLEARNLIGICARLITESESALSFAQSLRSYIKEPEWRVEAWHICQCLDAMLESLKPLKASARRVLAKTGAAEEAA